MKKSIHTHLLLSSVFFISLITLSSCDQDDPIKEDAPELITKTTLTFTPTGGGAAVVATASDPDGEGVQNIKVDGPINLAANKTYVLTLTLINELAKPTESAYDITGEVEEEGDEHLFFFSWTANVFANPTGNGNIDNRADAVNYNDMDAGHLPIGLSTTWTTVNTGGALAGKFRIVLKHQPGTKSLTSTHETGETDLDLEFTINVE